MCSPFLIGFSRVLLVKLLEERLVEVYVGREERVILYVAEFLGAVPEGGSLVSSVAKALLSCSDVLELYADDAELKAQIQDLQGTPAAWVSG